MKSYSIQVSRLLTLFSLMATAATAAPSPVGGDEALKQQIAEPQAKTRQLEAAHSAKAPATTPSPGMPAINMTATPSPAASMPGMPAGGAGASGAMGMGDMGGMPMSPPASPAMPGGGMGGMMTGMMGMMNQMMGMGPMPAASPGMAIAPPAIPQSALPGFPGVSHLYHIGSTGFFLEHAQHIGLSSDQQAALTKLKEQALAAKTGTDRQIEQAEQEMATLTSVDQPDAAKIEAKVREIEKLHTDERLSFIRAVGDAAKLLTEDQRKTLTGAMPAAAPSPSASMGSMPDM